MIYIYASNNMEKATFVGEIKNICGELEMAAYSDEKSLYAISKLAVLGDYIFLVEEPRKRLSGKAVLKHRKEGEGIVAFAQRVCLEEGWGEEEITNEKIDNIYKNSVQSINRQGNVTEEAVRATVQDFTVTNYRFSSEDCTKVVDQVYNKLRGYGILEEIWLNPAYSEIMINGLEEIVVEENGQIHGTGKAFASKEDLMNVVRRLALDGGGKSIDETNPMLDAEIIAKDGSRNRINIVLDCVAKKGPIITIRKKARAFFALEELVAEEDARLFLDNIVKAGYNIFISGGTGSGKTTLLNIVFTDPDMKRMS